MRSWVGGWRVVRSLQLKFTLTYTLVTLVTLTALYLVLVVVTNQFSAGTSTFGLLAADALRQSGRDLAPALTAQPPDKTALQTWLDRTYTTRAVLIAHRGPDGAMEGLFTSVAAAGTRLLILDAAGQVLAANGADAPSAEANAVLAPALAGEERPERLWVRDGQRLLAAAPVLAAGGRVVGAVVLELVPPSQWELLGIALASALPSTVILGATAGVIGLGVGALTARGLVRRLKVMAATTAAWGRGDFSRRLAERPADEVGQLAGDLNQMAGDLQTLLRARQELATLEERNRLARDLHDSVKQQVFAVAMNLGAAQALWEARPEAARQRVEAALDVARQAQGELTQMLQTLRPAPLAEQGLAAALREWVQAWGRQTGIAAICQVPEGQRLPEAVEQAFFRVAQEALANVARHSGASAASLNLTVSGDQAALQVTDNGRGFAVGQAAHGLGLRSIQERVQAVGGRLVLESGPQGTHLTVTAPLKDGESA